MSLYFPEGEFLNEVPDPERLSREFQRAAAAASAMTHWNFQGSQFSSSVVEDGTIVKVSEATNVATLNTDATTKPSISSGAHANSWNVPYQKGLHEVYDGDCTVTWTSTYPELVLCFFSFQYTRALLTGASTQTDEYSGGLDNLERTIRLRMKLSLDDAILSGTGPGGQFQEGYVRGTGYSAPDMPNTLTWAGVIPPGFHKLAPMAGQSPSEIATEVGDNWAVTIHNFMADPPYEGTTFFNGHTIVIRFAMGGQLGA